MKWVFRRRSATDPSGANPERTAELRAAVVGLGKLGLLHAATLNALPGCRLVAVSDTTKTLLSAIESTLPGIRTYADHRKLIDECKPDVVAIATPTGLHCSIATDFVLARIPVFIEKPLAARLEQATPLSRALEVQPVTTMVGYMTRFIPTFEKAKEIIDSGALGRGQMFRSSMYIWQLFNVGKGWRYDRTQSGGGVMITQNSHVIDLLLWYFGRVATVSAHTSRFYSKAVEDHAHVVFECESGLRGFMDASWSARHHRTPSIAIHYQGEQGTLDVDDDEVRLFLDRAYGDYTSGWRTWSKPDLPSAATIDIGGAHYTRQMEAFVSAVRGVGRVQSDVRSALETQRVIEAAYRSAERNGEPIRVHA